MQGEYLALFDSVDKIQVAEKGPSINYVTRYGGGREST